MKTYIISKMTNCADWSEVPSLNVACTNWRQNPGIEMSAQIAWDEQGLYFRSKCKEEHIRAEIRGDGQDVYKDSCMEFFFRPCADDPRYINIETNPNGAQYIGIGTGIRDHIHLIPEGSGRLFDVKTEIREHGWNLSFHIPLSFLKIFFNDIIFRSGDVIFANVYKCGDLTKVRHALSWNPMDMNNRTFHNPEYFGKMILE